PSRTTTFVGQVGFTVAVDPTPLPSGKVAVYAAFSNGLYRSIDSGNTWQLIKAGDCTDVVLAPQSLDVNGNEQILYAAFQGPSSGFFMTPTALPTTSLNLMGGGQGVNTRVQNGTSGPFDTPIPILNDTLSPNGKGGRIVLAIPDVNKNQLNPLQNTFYKG